MSDNVKDLKNGKIEIEDLEKYLEENRDEIDIVVLEWVCENMVIHCETSYEVADGTANDGTWIYAEFIADKPDLEYSYAGDVDGAIDFAKSYDCWDGHEFTRDGPVLYAREGSYDPDQHRFPMDEEVLTDSDLRELCFVCLGTYTGRDGILRPYDGPIRKKKYLLEEDE